MLFASSGSCLCSFQRVGIQEVKRVVGELPCTRLGSRLHTRAAYAVYNPSLAPEAPIRECFAAFLWESLLRSQTCQEQGGVSFREPGLKTGRPLFGWR